MTQLMLQVLRIPPQLRAGCHPIHLELRGRRKINSSTIEGTASQQQTKTRSRPQCLHASRSRKFTAKPQLLTLGSAQIVDLNKCKLSCTFPNGIWSCPNVDNSSIPHAVTMKKHIERILPSWLINDPSTHRVSTLIDTLTNFETN